jgi:hypothetical protein
MREKDWDAWVKEHKALLGMSGPVAADLFGAWKPFLANATLEELRDCSLFIAGSVERAKLPWATHLAMIRERLHERRQERSRSGVEINKKLPPKLSTGRFAEMFAKRDADRHKSRQRQHAEEVKVILGNIGNGEEAKLPKNEVPE